MASTDALALPRKNTAFRVYFDIRKNDGTIIVGWSGANANISQDAASATAATNSPTEIATSFGRGYLDLTSGEMNCNCLIIRIAVNNTGALEQTIILYPADDTMIRVNVIDWVGSAVNALQSGRVDSYVGAVASGVIAAASFASGALDAVWSTATRVLTAGTNIVLAKGTGITGFNDISDANVQTDVQAALTAQGYTTTRAGYLDTLDGLVQAIWDAATSALTTAGSIGAYLLSKLGLIVSNDVIVDPGTNPITGAWTLYDQDYSTATGWMLPTWSDSDWSALDLLNAQSITAYWQINGADEVAFPVGAVTVIDATTVKLTSLTRAQAQAVKYAPTLGFMIRVVLSVAKGAKEIELVNTSLTHKNYVVLDLQP